MDSMETVHSYVVTSDDPQQQYQQLQQQCLQLQQQNQRLQQQLHQLQTYNEHDLGSSTQRPQQNYKQQQPQPYPDNQQQSSNPHASQPQLEICISDEKQLNAPPEPTLSALYRTKSNPLPTHSAIAQGSYSEEIYDARNQAHITSYHNQHISPHPLYGQRRDLDGSSSYRNKSCIDRFRYRLGKKIECRAAHLTILFLTIADIILVMLQIGASLLHPHMSEKEVWYLELFSHLSLAIVSLFMLEILLKLFAFGPRYFWRGTPHWALHLVDAVIILTTFLLEILLKGVSQEIGSLLIIFRLWRVVKLMGTIAVGVSSHEQEHAALLEARIRELEKELEEKTLRCQRLEGFNSQPRSEN
ncbi:hypothetical protein BGZ93_005975 [Podila epicladia]|nr:hypothetical protein BGZ92_008134 [Podila epicladia]KAG0095358.1 hypothetical protein BGZ93_005975 [Podila epicladia]